MKKISLLLFITLILFIFAILMFKKYVQTSEFAYRTFSDIANEWTYEIFEDNGDFYYNDKFTGKKKLFFSDNVALIRENKLLKNGGWISDNMITSFIDMEGNVVLRPSYIELFLPNRINLFPPKFAPYTLVDDFSEGLAAVQWESWGYINLKGKVVIPLQFSQANYFSEGLAAVLPKNKGLWGYINKSGEYIIPAEHGEAYRFNNGLAQVGTIRKEYQFIDSNGKSVQELDTPIWSMPELDSAGVGYGPVPDKYTILDNGAILMHPQGSVERFMQPGEAYFGSDEDGNVVIKYWDGPSEYDGSME